METELPAPENSMNSEFKVYKTRWFMLAIFTVTLLLNTMHWIQYSIIANITMHFYNVSLTTVNWTSYIYLLMYPTLMLPATYITSKKGLRLGINFSALMNCLGSWIKVFSASPDLFCVAFIGQTVLAVGQMFILSAPSRVAATWFGPTQVSTACAIGIFGMQLGASLGFVVTPQIVRKNSTHLAQDFFVLYIILAVFTTGWLIVTFLFFRNEPPTPPSYAQQLEKENAAKFSAHSWKSFSVLFRNGPFWMVVLQFGISLGVLNALATLINPIVTYYFEHGEKLSGIVGFLLIGTGTISALIFGYILDTTRRFKETNVVVYTLEALSLIAFSFVLTSRNVSAVICSSVFLGFFLSGYYALGVEFAVEVTFPEPEFNSSSILVSVAQTSGILFTSFFTWILFKHGVFWCNIGMSLFLFIGVLVTILTPNIRHRQDAFNAKINN